MRHDSSVDDAAKAGGYDAGNIIQMKSLDFDVSYKFRALEPIVPMHKVLYPCLVADDKRPGQLRQSWRALRLPMKYKSFDWVKQPTVVEILKQIDLEIRRQNRVVGTTDEIKSFFEPQKVWVFPVFDRRDSEPVIKFFEAGWMIFNGIRTLRNMPDEDDPNKLAFGPQWIHDIVIRKTKKEGNMKENFKTVYSVKESKNNPFAGTFDKAILLRENLEELEANAVELKIFTTDEWAQLQMFSEEAEMFPLYAPQSPEEILEQLTEKAPLCLDAQNKDQARIFPSPRDFSDAMRREKLTHGSVEGGLIMIAAAPSSGENANVETGEPPEAQKTEAEIAETAVKAAEPTTEIPVETTQPAAASVSEPEQSADTQKPVVKSDKLANLMSGQKKKKAATVAKATVAKPASTKVGKPPGFVNDFSKEV